VVSLQKSNEKYETGPFDENGKNLAMNLDGQYPKLDWNSNENGKNLAMNLDGQYPKLDWNSRRLKSGARLLQITKWL